VRIGSKARFLKFLAQAIGDTRKAWKARDPQAPGTTIRYRTLLKYLISIRRAVRTGKVPSDHQRRSDSPGWILGDGWDPADFLVKLIGETDQYCLKKL
jgi:hypothetical protein